LGGLEQYAGSGVPALIRDDRPDFCNAGVRTWSSGEVGELVDQHICPLRRGSLRQSKTGACKGLKAFRRLRAWGSQAAGGL